MNRLNSHQGMTCRCTLFMMKRQIQIIQKLAFNVMNSSQEEETRQCMKKLIMSLCVMRHLSGTVIRLENLTKTNSEKHSEPT